MEYSSCSQTSFRDEPGGNKQGEEHQYEGKTQARGTNLMIVAAIPIMEISSY